MTFRNSWKHAGLVLALVSLIAAPAAVAQTGVAGTDSGETGLFTLFTGDTLPQGEVSFSLYYNNWDRIVTPFPAASTPAFSSEWDYDWHRLSAAGAYGLTDSLELAVQVPYDVLDASDNRRAGLVNGFPFVEEIDASGLGDVRVGLKWRVTGEQTPESSKLALFGFVEAPTGDDDEGLVSGDTGFGGGLAWSQGNWAVNLGYRDRGSNDLTDFDLPGEIEAGVGYVGQVSSNERFHWITELVGTFYTGGDEQPEDNLDLTSGGRLWLGEGDRWAFNFALRTDLLQLDNTDEYCPIGGLVGLTYFPRFLPPPPPAPEPPPPPPPPAPEPQPEPEPAPEPPPPPPAPEPPQEERVTVNFSSGSARVSNIAKAKLDEVALKMKQDQELTALVIGYTDSQGSPASNQRMSERRAEAVKAYLVDRHDIDPARITVEGRGSADPVGDNATREGRADNRRAVVILTVQ